MSLLYKTQLFDAFVFRVNKLIPLLPTITVATGSFLSYFNVEASQRQPVKRQFESTAPLALSRSAPESTFVSQLHTFSRRSLEKTLPFREHTKVERVLPTRRATKTATLPG